ncbi:hypothetical protein [Aquabacterium sp.]
MLVQAYLSFKGCIDMPLGEAFRSPCCGRVVDRFGLCWMVGIPGQP